MAVNVGSVIVISVAVVVTVQVEGKAKINVCKENNYCLIVRGNKDTRFLSYYTY